MVKIDLTRELALITGATGGIGKATARCLATHGCAIAIHYKSSAAEAADLARTLHESYGVRAECFSADLSSYAEASCPSLPIHKVTESLAFDRRSMIDCILKYLSSPFQAAVVFSRALTEYIQVRRLHKEVVNSMGEPSILFNNAGLTLKHGVKDIREISVEDFETTWRTNCGSTFLLTQLCLPAMGQHGWGKIIFCSSVARFTGGVVGPHYAPSKSALHGLMHWLSQTYRRKGVAVNGVAPALIQDTKMLAGNNTELAQKIPMGFLGRPEEVAETVLWLVRADYVTNKVVGVGGGMFAQ